MKQINGLYGTVLIAGLIFAQSSETFWNWVLYLSVFIICLTIIYNIIKKLPFNSKSKVPEINDNNRYIPF